MLHKYSQLFVVFVTFVTVCKNLLYFVRNIASSQFGAIKKQCKIIQRFNGLGHFDKILWNLLWLNAKLEQMDSCVSDSSKFSEISRFVRFLIFAYAYSSSHPEHLVWCYHTNYAKHFVLTWNIMQIRVTVHVATDKTHDVNKKIVGHRLKLWQ